MFPCKKCLVISVCQDETCPNLITNKDTLYNHITEDNICPDCGFPIKADSEDKANYYIRYNCWNCRIVYYVNFKIVDNIIYNDYMIERNIDYKTWRKM